MDREEEFRARRQAVEAALKKLEELGIERELPSDVLDLLRNRHGERLWHVKQRVEGDESHRKLIEAHDDLEFTLIEAERREINELYRKGELKDEARRRIERSWICGRRISTT